MSLSTNLLDALSPENKVFVAFSGGLDSTALLFLCNKALKQKKIRNLQAIHINHNLSENSDKWEQHCERFCKSNNIEFGFAIGYLLNWSEKYNGVDEYGANVNKLEYSIHIGGEYKIYNNLYFNTRISNSIFPIRPHISGETYKWNKGQYNTSISFAINYHILKDSRLRTR